MREILYRGINHETGKFVYGFYTKLLNGVRITHNIIVEDEEAESRFTQFYIHNKETIGQYTGLTDKNGTKAFRGDISRSFHYADASGKEFYLSHVIEWSDKYHGWLMVNLDSWHKGDFDLSGSNGNVQMMTYIRTKQIEIIGNIHEGEKK